MIYFIRHGQSQANAANVFSGPDSLLTDLGRQQAKIAGKKIMSDGLILDRIISSTYGRAVDTAKIIAKEINFNVNLIQYDHRLVEYNAGELIGKTESGVTAQQVVDAKDAENLTVLYNRVFSALKDIKLLPGNSLIVSHAGIGRMIEIIKNQMDPDDFYTIPAYKNAEVIELDLLDD